MSKTAAAKAIVETVPDAYQHLKAKFPLGIAQIVPIYTPYDKTEFLQKPTKEQLMDPENYRKPKATSIIVEMQRSRGTHEVTGLPNIKPQIYDVIIWPTEPLTSNCGQMSSDFKDNPWAIIDVLLNHDAYGKLFKLVKPAAVIMERIEEARQNPAVRQQLENRQKEMRRGGTVLKKLDKVDPNQQSAGRKRPLPNIGRPGQPIPSEDENDEALDLMPEADLEMIGVEEEEAEG